MSHGTKADNAQMEPNPKGTQIPKGHNAQRHTMLKWTQIPLGPNTKGTQDTKDTRNKGIQVPKGHRTQLWGYPMHKAYAQGLCTRPMQSFARF
jgi:hypothetical protein